MSQVEPFGVAEVWILREKRARAWGEQPENPTVFMGPIMDVQRAKAVCKGLNEKANEHGVYYKAVLELDLG